MDKLMIKKGREIKTLESVCRKKCMNKHDDILVNLENKYPGSLWSNVTPPLTIEGQSIYYADIPLSVTLKIFRKIAVIVQEEERRNVKNYIFCFCLKEFFCCNTKPILHILLITNGINIRTHFGS